MRINTNIMALNAQNRLGINQTSVEKSIQKLSSGLRINGAADDASGLAISEKMRSQIRGLSQAQSNAQDGISLIQTAEGALQQTTDILQRMRELVIKAQNTGVLTDSDRTSISTELSTLQSEVDRIATSTTFNGKKLLDGTMATKVDSNGFGTKVVNIDVASAAGGATFTFTGNLSGTTKGKIELEYKNAKGDVVKTYSDVEFKDYKSITGKVNFAEAGISIDFGTVSGRITQKSDLTTTVTTEEDTKRADFKIGANTYKEDILSCGIGSMTAKGLNRFDQNKNFQIDISNAAEANKTLDAIDYAIEKVSSQRANLGVIQNRMEYAISNLSTTEENLTAAESRIRDVDMAEEMVAYTKNTILNQSAMSMLAQANQQPQSILSLLQ